MIGLLFKLLAGKSALQKPLQNHFKGTSLHQIVTSARDFPITSRVDVETSLDALLSSRSGTRLFGIHAGMSHETPTMAHLLAGGGPFSMDVGPLQHDELDIGDTDPVRCLKNGLWLSQTGGVPIRGLVGTGAKLRPD